MRTLLVLVIVPVAIVALLATETARTAIPPLVADLPLPMLAFMGVASIVVLAFRWL